MQYHVKEIAQGYSCHTIEVSPFEQNCRLIWKRESKIGVIIDPGTDLDRIFAFVAANHIKIQAIWLTHGHIDHAAEALDAAERLQTELIGPHIAEKELLSSMAEHVAKMKDQVPNYAYFNKARNCTNTKWLKEGDIVDIEGLEFKVIYGPGHSPGHVAYYSATANCLISGDIIFYESVGRTDLYGSCPNSLKSTIIDKILPLPDETLVLAGHGPDFTLGEIRHKNVFLLKWAKKA